MGMNVTNDTFLLFRFANQSERVTVTNNEATKLNFILVAESLEMWSYTNDFNISDNLNEDHYFTYDEINSKFEKFQYDYPDIASTFLIPTNYSDQSLLAIKLKLSSDFLLDDQKIRIALIGGLNAGDVIGQEVLVRFISHLLKGKADKNYIKIVLDVIICVHVLFIYYLRTV